jgi:hypothetical protein
MTLIFHQNMRDYGGNSAPRNALYAARFGAISATPTVPNGVLVAGFTEIMNSGVGLHANMPGVIQNLDAGLTNFIVIYVGTTSVGRRAEYIAIATDPVFVAAHAGQVLINPVTAQWAIYNTPAAAVVNNRIGVPGGVNLQADSRGVAYVAGTFAGNQYIIGFMHNMYNEGNKTGAFTNLGRVAQVMRQNVPGYGAARVIIGGDFNVAPRNPTRRGGVPLHSCCKRSALTGLPIWTTIGMNSYDFFVANTAQTDANAEVWGQTMVIPLGSDHAGVGLEI